MAKLSRISQAFTKLGDFLKYFYEAGPQTENKAFNEFESVIARAQQQNAWFTQVNIKFALIQWAKLLTKAQLTDWLSLYPLEEKKTKCVAIIMAGNIPLVGFHDFLSVLITGNKAICKLSSNDKVLLPFIAKQLVEIEPLLDDRIDFIEGKLEQFDAVIATGSNNTSRYFEYYFGKGPNIIRKNRTSVAVLSGNESTSQLERLGDDIFNYYGLGCRNVSKVFVPKEYNFETFFESLFKHKHVIEHHKYANNYDYNKAVYLMSDFKILDNGFMILKEDNSLYSPISVIFYEYYSSIEELKKLLDSQKERIQCVVSSLGYKNEVSFGQTQSPELNDYADGVDTIQFLTEL